MECRWNHLSYRSVSASLSRILLNIPTCLIFRLKDLIKLASGEVSEVFVALDLDLRPQLVHHS
jgi:hypothetical protein